MQFFKQAGVYQVSSPEELFMDVTSCSFKGEGKVFAAEVCIVFFLSIFLYNILCFFSENLRESFAKL